MFLLIGLKIAATFLSPLLLIIFSLNGIKSITSTEILLRLNAPINKFIFIMIPFYAIYSLILLLNSTIIGVLLSLLFFSVAVMIPINSIVRSKKTGIYKNGIVTSDNQCKWDKIEAFALISNGIRFIQMGTGAFDIKADENVKAEAERILISIGIKQIEIAQ